MYAPRECHGPCGGRGAGRTLRLPSSQFSASLLTPDPHLQCHCAVLDRKKTSFAFLFASCERWRPHQPGARGGVWDQQGPAASAGAKGNGQRGAYCAALIQGELSPNGCPPAKLLAVEVSDPVAIDGGNCDGRVLELPEEVVEAAKRLSQRLRTVRGGRGVRPMVRAISQCKAGRAGT